MEALKSKIEIAQHFSKLDKATKKLSLCFVSLFEECEEKSINSHTISKVNLRLLTGKEGSLLTFERPDVFQAIKSDENIRDSYEFAKIGLKAISSFPGFCSSHDSKLFRQIDSANLEISANSVELLVFRTFVHEAYKKLCAQHTTQSYTLSDASNEEERQSIHEGFQLGYLDLVVQAQGLYKNLQTKKHDYKFLEITFSELLPFCFLSPINFEIKRAFGGQDPRAYKSYDSCLIGLIPTNAGSKFVLAFPRSQQKNIYIFLDRLGISKADLPTKILQLALESSENLYFKTAWIESLPKKYREILGDVFHRDLSVTDVLGGKYLPDTILEYSGRIHSKSNTLITRKWRARLS